MDFGYTACSYVRSTRSTYEYRAPLENIEPIAELEAVDTALYKNLLALMQGILIALLHYNE